MLEARRKVVDVLGVEILERRCEMVLVARGIGRLHIKPRAGSSCRTGAGRAAPASVRDRARARRDMREDHAIDCSRRLRHVEKECTVKPSAPLASTRLLDAPRRGIDPAKPGEPERAQFAQHARHWRESPCPGLARARSPFTTRNFLPAVSRMRSRSVGLPPPPVEVLLSAYLEKFA